MYFHCHSSAARALHDGTPASPKPSSSASSTTAYVTSKNAVGPLTDDEIFPVEVVR